MVASTRDKPKVKDTSIRAMAGGNTFDIWLSDVEHIDRYLRGELDIAIAKLKGEKPSIGSLVWDS